MKYFDHNATTPLSPVARQAWLEASDTFLGNPSSPHRAGARAEAALNLARQRLARLLGCSPLEIVWTSGATESNNMALHHLAKTLDPSSEVWISAVEHPCVMESARRRFGHRIRWIPVNRWGAIEVNWLAEESRTVRPGAVAVMAANNETGVLQPWREILKFCRERGFLFFCDAAQWMGKLPGDGLGACDLVSGSAHKFGGPRGAGFLKCPGQTVPLLVGGKQEDGRRAGTENVPGVLSMMAALSAREEALTAQETAQRLQWRAEFERKLSALLPEVEIVGGSTERLWNTVMAIMPETDCRQRWVVKLDKAGFAVSTGSACSSGREEPSHVLEAIGFDPARAGRALRFSSGLETAPGEWDNLAEAVRAVYLEFQQAGKNRATTIP